ERFGAESKAGNSALIYSYQHDGRPLSWKMAPLIFVSTLLTHLFGGSAGREGTAVQMGASIGTQLSRLFVSTDAEKRMLLLMGIAAGFASVFGTPLAGFIFAFEFLWAKDNWKQRIMPVLASAFLSHFVCLAWGIQHTPFQAILLPDFSVSTILNIVFSGLCFGLAARLFVFLQNAFSKLFLRINNPYYRIFLGAVIILLLVKLFKLNAYTGLGIEEILNSFQYPQNIQVFFLKIFLTTLTLSIGFKGGEVTPLFFIGASLGSALVWFFPLPVSFLAALGLIAVFASAAQVPFASIVLGIELFGFNAFPYYVLVCLAAFISSGSKGIYSAHPMQALKRDWFSQIKYPWEHP
ncbi:MAG: chloride channel protein, partial [Bacteroidia bacterium]|nr:chloride channel protein [Bacteroidia bacterium]